MMNELILKRIADALELFERLVIAQETIAANLQLQTEFAKARSKTAEKVAKHRAGKKVTVTSQAVTEKYILATNFVGNLVKWQVKMRGVSKS